ncbi:MAG: DUF455 family protein [Myxococcota bacterium]
MATVAHYAEQILHATTLSAKLAGPTETLVDRQTPPRSLPDHPGRPEGLSLGRGPRPSLPSPRDRLNDTQRAVVLHAMANHELLAVELFALALLRFPDAPRGLRRSWLATLRDEQRHVSHYVSRLEDLGVQFGEYAVSAFFWDALHRVDNPLSFISGLELGLEQANLDFSRLWAAAFRRAGDEATASVLDAVHDDEIRHVRVGAHWLRQLKDPKLDDFDAWTQALRFPLTPVRGRGPTVVREARRAAGLDDDFIDRISVTTNSRGRSPRVFLFTSSLEDEWADRTPSRIPTDIDHDLGPILSVLASPDDVVIAEAPTRETLVRWSKRGLPIPQFVPELNPDAWPGQGVPEPWGWSPAMRDRFATVTDALPTIEGQSELHEKTWALRQLQQFAEAHEVEAKDVGQVATTWAEVDAIRNALGECWVKAPLSTSGQHRVRVPPGPLDARSERAVRRLLAAGSVVVERHLPVVAELSTHVQVGETARIVGTTRFGSFQGIFRGVVLGSPNLGLPSDVRRAFAEQRFVDQATAAARQVGEAARAKGFRGPLSVDALVVGDSTLRLKPISEVNARYTMGHLGMRLRRRLAGDVGLWLFLPIPSLRKAGFESAAAAFASLPAHVVATNEPTTARRILTLLWSRRRYADVLAEIQAWLAQSGEPEALAQALAFSQPIP